jgi:hypothetical protein
MHAQNLTQFASKHKQASKNNTLLSNFSLCLFHFKLGLNLPLFQSALICLKHKIFKFIHGFGESVIGIT